MALNKKQQKLLDLIKTVDKTMSEHGIEYYLFGGSTIGALRHNGFIPWDDDIDIILDKENFYKLVELYSGGPINDVELVYFHNDPYWYRPFAMLVYLNDTCYTRPCLFNRGKALGTRIDVMICDSVPYDKLSEYRDLLMLYDDFVTDSMLVNPALYYQKEDYYALKEREKVLGKPAVELEIRRALESFEGEDADYLVVRFWTKELRYYKKDVVLGPLYHKFEDTKLPVPAKPQEQLRNQFGYGWYIVPDQEEMLSHNFYNNYYISGNNYDDDVMRFIDLDKVEPQVRENKKIRIERRSSIDPSRKILSHLVVQKALMRTDVKRRANDLKRLLNAGEYQYFYDEMLPVITDLKHFSEVDSAYRGIDIDLLRGLILSTIMCGKYFQAIAIANAFDAQEICPDSNEMHLLTQIMKLAEAYQDGDDTALKNALDTFTEQEKQSVPDCILALIRLHKHGENPDNKSVEDLLDLCNSYLKQFPKNWEINKVKADLLTEKGREEDALAIYDLVHKYTLNGLDLFELEKKFGYEPRFGQLPDENELE